MTKVVHKHKLAPGLPSKVDLRNGGKLVHFGMDGDGDFCIWGESPVPWEAGETETYQVFGTGLEIEDDDAVHLGTTIMNGFVFHLYRLSK